MNIIAEVLSAEAGPDGGPGVLLCPGQGAGGHGGDGGHVVLVVMVAMVVMVKDITDRIDRAHRKDKTDKTYVFQATCVGQL